METKKRFLAEDKQYLHYECSSASKLIVSHVLHLNEIIEMGFDKEKGYNFSPGIFLSDFQETSSFTSGCLFL